MPAIHALHRLDGMLEGPPPVPGTCGKRGRETGATVNDAGSREQGGRRGSDVRRALDWHTTRTPESLTCSPDTSTCRRLDTLCARTHNHTDNTDHHTRDEQSNSQLSRPPTLHFFNAMSR